jgi:transposase
VYDIEFTVTKRTTVTPKLKCPKDQAVKQAVAPEDAKGVNQYGIKLRTMAVLLYTAGMVSLNRIHDIIAPMFGIQLSETTVLNAVHSLAGKVRGTVDAILDAERKLKVIHCDETGARVDGKMHWIHCVASELYTFVTIQEARGKDALDAIGFLKTYVGTVVHDCLSAYWKMDEENGSLTHAVCNEHIERELAGLSKFFHNASLWADDMLALLQEMLHEKHRLKEQGAACISREALESFSARFDALIKRGKELHPLPQRKPGQRGRIKRGRARSLVDRMENRKEEIFRFLTDFDVPYTNNIAEASFRLLGAKKAVGSFRTIENAKDFCVIWSYLSTAKKHGHSYFEAVYEAFRCNSYNLIFPDKCKPADEQKTA